MISQKIADWQFTLGHLHHTPLIDFPNANKGNANMSDATDTTTSKGMIAAVFLDHPATVNETYFQHMRFALGFAFWLVVAGLAALVHALIPAACETTASRILRRLVAKMDARH